jgi:hypothetical protein
MNSSKFFLLLMLACANQQDKANDEPTSLEFSVYPPASGLGMSVEVDVDANRSAFSYADTTFSFGDDIEILGVNVNDNWSARAEILIDPDATVGIRDVVVYTDGKEYTVDNSFEVVSQSFILEPDNGKIGECIEIGILGNNTEWQGGLTWPHFGDGIEVIDFEVYTNTLAEASISINAVSSPGWRNVTVDSGGGDYTVVYDAFKVDRVGLAASWEPVLAAQGRTIEFTVRARNTDFLSSVPDIQFFDRFGENPDIVIRNMVVLDAENLYGRMQLSNAAALGARDVIIDTVNDSVRIENAFEVTGLDWNISDVAISLDFYVVRYTDQETCDTNEKVTATAIFWIPLDPPCGGAGSGEPQDGPSPYDNNGLFELVQGEQEEEDCPFPTTLSAGDYVWFESPYNIVTLEKTYESASGTIYYEGKDLIFADYVPDQLYDLHTQGDPDGLGEYLIPQVQPTVPADWHWLTPDMCGLVQPREDGFLFEWTPAQTYPKAIFATFIYGTLVENNKPGFAGVVPWDDGIHGFTPSEILGLVAEPVRMESLSYIKGPYFGLPNSIYQYCRSDSYIAYISEFQFE